MTRTVSAEFTTRRDAEMAVEHIVQEHGVDRSDVTIAPVSSENTAGTEVARADLEGGSPKGGTEGEPALAGKIKVSVQVDDAKADQVTSSFKTFNGQAAA